MSPQYVDSIAETKTRIADANGKTGIIKEAYEVETFT